MRWRLSRLLQFRLRTLLLAMTLLAVAVRVWMTPPLPSHKLAGGTTIQASRFLSEIKGGSDWGAQVPDGAFRVRDPHGRLQCTGTMIRGRPTGRWTYYHPNGRRALVGTYREGLRVGTWKAWDEHGKKQAAFGFAVPGQIDWPAERVSPSYPGGAETNLDVRHGPMTVWRDDGRVVVQGAFRDGHRHGPWTFGERDGSTSELCYHAGQSAVPPTREQIAALRSRLRNTEPAVTRDALPTDDFPNAVAAAEQLGADGVELLCEALNPQDEFRCRIVLRALTRLGMAAQRALPALEKFEGAAPAKVLFELRLAQVAIGAPSADRKFDALVTEFLETTPIEQHHLFEQLLRVGAAIVPHLERLLDQPGTDRPLLALLALDRLRSDRARPAAEAAIRRASHHSRSEVAAAAQTILTLRARAWISVVAHREERRHR